MNNFEKNFTPYTLYFTLFYYLCTIIHSSQFTVHGSTPSKHSPQVPSFPEGQKPQRGGSLPWEGEGWGHSLLSTLNCLSIFK